MIDELLELRARQVALGANVELVEHLGEIIVPTSTAAGQQGRE